MSLNKFKCFVINYISDVLSKVMAARGLDRDISRGQRAFLHALMSAGFFFK